MKSYKFALRPTKEQTKKLELSLDICRRTYNHLLSELSNGFNKNELSNFLLDLKVCYPEMKQVYSKTLQVENDNLFSNLSGLHVLRTNGRKVGRLRYKGKGWKKTFTYNQSGFKFTPNYKYLHLSKIGDIRCVVHREVEGKIKQVIIKKEINKWFAIIQTDYVIKRKCGIKEIGMDMSPSKFVITSENKTYSMPKEIDQTLHQLKKCHRKVSKKKRGSKNRMRTRVLLQTKYLKLNNQKQDFYHKLSYKLVSEFKVIGIEDLNIKGMMMGYYSAVNFQKSGWSTFVNKYLISKAESAGCQVFACDRFEPTSKKCSSCGWINKELTLADRTFVCSDCGLEIDRDLNASINIKKTCRLGTNLCGADTSLVEMPKVSVLKQEKFKETI